jgi:hypothetical protein
MIRARLPQRRSPALRRSGDVGGLWHAGGAGKDSPGCSSATALRQDWFDCRGVVVLCVCSRGRSHAEARPHGCPDSRRQDTCPPQARHDVASAPGAALGRPVGSRRGAQGHQSIGDGRPSRLTCWGEQHPEAARSWVRRQAQARDAASCGLTLFRTTLISVGRAAIGPGGALASRSARTGATVGPRVPRWGTRPARGSDDGLLATADLQMTPRCAVSLSYAG